MELWVLLTLCHLRTLLCPSALWKAKKQKSSGLAKVLLRASPSSSQLLGSGTKQVFRVQQVIAYVCLSLKDMVLKPAHWDRAGKLEIIHLNPHGRMCLASTAGLCISALTNPHMLSGSQLEVVRSEASHPHHSQITANSMASVNKGADRGLSDFWKIFLNEKEDMTVPMNSGGEGYCR